MKRRIYKTLLILLGLFVLVVLAFNGSPNVSKEDRTYIRTFMKEWGISTTPDSIHTSFDAEFSFISKVQDSLLRTVKSTQAPNERVGDLASYYSHRTGICYDRAIILEKIFTEYGFDIRHLYVYFRTDSTPTRFKDFFKKGLNSHALLEVRTKKGWMVVGTNHNWIGLDSSRSPLTLEQVRDQLKNNTFHPLKPSSGGDNFYSILAMPWNFRFAYGIYSRHGQFLHSTPIEDVQKWVGIKSLFPDYNIRMLLYNF